MFTEDDDNHHKYPPFPSIDALLLEKLEASFPERTAELEWTDREIWYKAGQVSVVRLLRSHFDQQNKTVLQPENHD